MSLPSRTPEAEDRFLQEHLDASEDTLIEQIRAAIDDRRPRLAGRLFQLLDEQIDPEPGSALDRAARAARLFLFRKTRPQDHSWSELTEAWEQAHRGRMRRIKQRQRDRHSGVQRRTGRFDRKRR